MRGIRIILLVLLAAAAGGAAGAVVVRRLGVQERVVERTSTQPPSGPRERPKAAQGREIEKAAATLVALVKKSEKAELIASNEAVANAVSLTSDGLIATASSFKDGSELYGITFDRQLLAVRIPSGKEKTRAYAADLVITFAKTTDFKNGQPPRLRSVEIAPFEELDRGVPLIAFESAGRITFPSLSRIGAEPDPGMPYSSEDIAKILKLDEPVESGAFVFDEQGRLVGIAREDGWVIPGEVLSALLRQYVQDAKIGRAALGVHFLDLGDLTAASGDPPSQGLLLTSARGRPAVRPGSPASRAGLRADDIILSFDGRRMDGLIPLSVLLLRYPPGTEVELVVLRGGKEEKLKVVLGGT